MTKTRIAAVVAAAALGAGALTGATMALAADGQASAPVHSERGAKDGHGNGQGPGHGPGEMREGPGGPLLHSEGVAEDAEGNFITVRMQHGEVTAVAATSLTVKSTDGYTSTYVIDDQTRLEREGDEGAPEVGDLVHVRATVDGGTATAVGVHALSPEKAAALQERRDGARGEGREGQGAGGPGRGGPGHGGLGQGGPGQGGPGHGGPADMSDGDMGDENADNA